MKRKGRYSLDWGLALAAALAVIAAAPFLTRPGLPHATDAELHVYRAVELAHTLRGGAFYPRWAPDLYLGYGYPIFNYYAPLTYYLAGFFALAPGLTVVGGVKAVFILGFFFAAIGTYLLGRELFNPGAGLIAAASFTFAPYVVFIDPHARGALAEHFATCLLPLAFYFFHRSSSGVGKRATLLMTVLTVSALLLSHNLLGLVSWGLLAAYWLWQILASPAAERPARIEWGGAIFALAAATTAFFWLPFLLERGAIKLQVTGAGHFDFHNHFLSLGELLAPSRILDLGATAPRYRFNLGLAQWALALPLLMTLGFRTRKNTDDTDFFSSVKSAFFRVFPCPIFFVLAAAGLIFLMLPASTPLWDRIPAMAYLQFPWRLLGPANLMLAVCAGGATAWLAEQLPARRRAALWAILLLAVLLLALPSLYPPMWAADFGGLSPRDIIEWEVRSLALGTTSTGDFLPVKAALTPVPLMPSLFDSYAAGGPVDRVNRFTLPHGATVELVEQRALYDRFHVRAPKPFLLRLYLFYFPGWRIYIDGVESPIQVAGPEGFITARIPEGEHEVVVRFGDTPPRTAGWIISAIGLAALVFVARAQSPTANTMSKRADAPTVMACALALLLFAILKAGVIDPRDDWMRYTSPPGQALAAQHELRANFGGQIELLGCDLPRRPLHPGDTFRVTLYWRALAPLSENYQSFVHLAWPLDTVWGQSDHLNPGDTPTSRWPLGKYVWDEHEIVVAPETPPGEYALNVGIYSLAGNYRLLRHDEAGQAVGDSFVIGYVQVEE